MKFKARRLSHAIIVLSDRDEFTVYVNNSTTARLFSQMEKSVFLPNERNGETQLIINGTIVLYYIVTN